MNYEPNTIQWPIGSAVIHDADAKTEAMLMRVVGYARDGCCRTRYIHPYCEMGNPRSQRTLRGVLTNRLALLHDPKRFGLDVEAGR